MHRTVGTDSKSKSRHNKEPQKELRKTRTQKDLHRTDKPTPKKVSLGRSSSNRDLCPRRQPHPSLPHQSKKQQEFFRCSFPANKLEPPKWNLQYRRQLQQSPPPKVLEHVHSEQQLRRIERDIFTEKPKIMKQKTESYTQLQHRLRSLQQKLELLKSSMVRGESKHAKSRSKDRKSQHSEEKNEEMFVQAQVLSSYVTQVKPALRKHSGHPDSLSGRLCIPYYVGHLSKHSRKSQLECPVYQHILQSASTFAFMKRLRLPETNLEQRGVQLKMHPRNAGRKTVIFDLDETLIHCNEVEGKRCDVILPVVFSKKQRIFADINIRPYAREVLESLAKHFELVVFTASHSCYANVVIDHLDPNKNLISHRLFREHCFETESGMYIKDLRVIRNRDLSQVVLVDNAAYSYFLQLDNGIPIVPFFNSRKDCELLSLQHFLIKEVLPARDVRSVLRESFRFHRYGEFSSPSKMIDALYL